MAMFDSRGQRCSIWSNCTHFCLFHEYATMTGECCDEGEAWHTGGEATMYMSSICHGGIAQLLEVEHESWVIWGVSFPIQIRVLHICTIIYIYTHYNCDRNQCQEKIYIYILLYHIIYNICIYIYIYLCISMSRTIHLYIYIYHYMSRTFLDIYIILYLEYNVI